MKKEVSCTVKYSKSDILGILKNHFEKENPDFSYDNGRVNLGSDPDDYDYGHGCPTQTLNSIEIKGLYKK